MQCIYLFKAVRAYISLAFLSQYYMWYICTDFALIWGVKVIHIYCNSTFAKHIFLLISCIFHTGTKNYVMDYRPTGVVTINLGNMFRKMAIQHSNVIGFNFKIWLSHTKGCKGVHGETPSEITVYILRIHCTEL